jgi:hypothetical protein
MATLDQRAREGDEARQVLDNPAFERAFNLIEKEHVEAWLNSPARDPQGRETLWMTVKLLHKLRATLEASMMDGKLANVELEHQEQILAQERRQGLAVDGMS